MYILILILFPAPLAEGVIFTPARPIAWQPTGRFSMSGIDHYHLEYTFISPCNHLRSSNGSRYKIDEFSMNCDATMDTLWTTTIDKIKTIRRTSVRGRSRGPRIYDRIKRSLWADADLYAENAVETVTQKVFGSSVSKFVRTTWQKWAHFPFSSD